MPDIHVLFTVSKKISILGLKYIKEMADQGTTEIRYDIETFDNTKAFEVYDDFTLGSNSTSYTLNIGSYTNSSNSK